MQYQILRGAYVSLDDVAAVSRVNLLKQRKLLLSCPLFIFLIVLHDIIHVLKT